MPNLIQEVPVETTVIDGTEQLYAVKGLTTDIRFRTGLYGFVMGLANRVINLLTGANIASAATINLNTATGNRVHITGTVTITAVTLTRGPRTLIFDGILTLTHHATNNNLPGGANITTAAGDRAIYESDGTTVYCIAYIPAAQAPVTGIVTLTGTQTLTNKRVTPRVGSTASAAQPAINTDTVDVYKLTAQAADITSMSANLSGTPTDNQSLIIEITGTGARAITWGASFESSSITLPATTFSTNMLTVGFIWNTATPAWRCIGVC